MEYGKLLAAPEGHDEEPAEGIPVHLDNLMADMHANASQQVGSSLPPPVPSKRRCSCRLLEVTCVGHAGKTICRVSAYCVLA